MQTRDPDTRTVPPIDTRKQWNALIESVETEGDAIVESESGAKAVLISFEEFQEIKEKRKERRREELMERLLEMEERQSRRNADLSDEEVEKIADKATREAIDELAAEGKLIFERDLT